MTTGGKPGFRRSSVYDAAVSERAGESMTVAQRDALAAELAELEGPKRAEMVEAIATARGFGDLSENFAYHDAKNEQGLLERRITILRSRIENAVIVEHAAEGVVGVGSVVEVEDEQGGRFEVEISSVGGVSTDSPLGSALVGAKVGDTVERPGAEGRLEGPRRLGALRLGRRTRHQLNRRWASSRPSRASVSTASAARATRVSASSSGANGERRSRQPGRRSPRPGRPTPTRSRRKSAEPNACLIERRPLWPGEPAAQPHLEPARLEVDLVVHDCDRVERHLVEPRRGPERAPGEVHVGLRLQQPEPKVTEADLGELAGELRAERAVVPACELVDDHPAGVVTVAGVLAARIAETRRRGDRASRRVRPDRRGARV